MAEVSVASVVGARTQAFGRTPSQRRGVSNAIVNISLRARALRERYPENSERINAAARRMVNKLI